MHGVTIKNLKFNRDLQNIENVQYMPRRDKTEVILRRICLMKSSWKITAVLSQKV